MKTLKNIGLSVLFLLLVVVMNSCYDDEVLPAGQEVVTGEVSFTQDIIPIFNASCNGSGCHNNGGIAPNLSSGAALSALTGGGYINTSDPENSELYQWMIGNRSVDMPLSGPIGSANAKVLAWIRQGALNN